MDSIERFERLDPSDPPGKISRSNKTDRLIYFMIYGAVMTNKKKTLRALLDKYPLKRWSYLIAIYSGTYEPTLVPEWLYTLNQRRDHSMIEYLIVRSHSRFFELLHTFLGEEKSFSLFRGILELLHNEIKPMALKLWPQESSWVLETINISVSHLIETLGAPKEGSLPKALLEWWREHIR